LRETARKLVGQMSAELCREDRLLDTGIACRPAPLRQDEYDCAAP
jgi:hypothetical protein